MLRRGVNPCFINISEKGCKLRKLSGTRTLNLPMFLLTNSIHTSFVFMLLYCPEQELLLFSNWIFCKFIGKHELKLWKAPFHWVKFCYRCDKIHKGNYVWHLAINLGINDNPVKTNIWNNSLKILFFFFFYWNSLLNL